MAIEADKKINGIYIIDKPQGFTSFDVCAKIRGYARRVNGEKNIKVGHGGTLDPLATGVLPVFVGREYTKTIGAIDSAEKEYIAGLRLGIITDTQDITGTVLSKASADVSESDLVSAVLSFVGNISQIPPMYSAVQVGGKRLYSLARQGVEIQREPRDITVFEAEVLSYSGTLASIRFVVSKGTYIRTLCGDIGNKLGCGGTMESLRRTRFGNWRIEDAVSLYDVTNPEVIK